MASCPSPSPSDRAPGGPPRPAAGEATPRLALRGIGKRFGGTWVLRGVDLTVRASEVHAVAGLNGSGKSTLMRTVYGAHEPTEGELLLDGRPCRFRSPREAIAAGVAAVPQELPLVPGLSVAENIFLGMLPRRAGLADLARACAEAERVLAHLHEDTDVRRPVGSLDLARRQLVTVARALVRKAGVVVFDEPTSALPAGAARRLREVVRTLRRDGQAVLFISQRLEDVFDVADEVTVLRDGRVVAQGPLAGFTYDSMVHWMVAGVPLAGGHAPASHVSPPTPTVTPAAGVGAVSETTGGGGSAAGHGFGAPYPPADLLTVRGLRVPGRVREVSFSLSPGEVVGLFGLAGCGAADILRAVFGAEPDAEGEIRLEGAPLPPGVRRRIDRGLAYVSGHRADGLVPDLTVAANISLPRSRRLARPLRHGTEAADAGRQIGALRIHPPDAGRRVSTLSGGNQQKVLVARWLAGNPAVWLLDDPTRGVDVQAQADIHRIIRERAASGRCGVLVYSSDLRELHAICDRGLVVADGGIVAEIDPRQLTEDEIRLLLEPAVHHATPASER